MEQKELSIFLKDRSLLKQEVYNNAKTVFSKFKTVLEKEVESLRKGVKDERVRTIYEDKGSFEAHAYVGSDVLVFNMHTNVFCFPDESPICKTSYVKKNKDLAYCGVFHIYNFLADSFLHGRMNDPGYLLARIFVNKEGHFYVEGKGKLGIDYRDFINCELTQEVIVAIIRRAIYQSVEFDLLSPPMDLVETASVMQIKVQSSSAQMKTGKRLGFKFEAERNKIK